MTGKSGKSYLIKTKEKASTPGDPSGSSEAASVESLKVEHTQMDARAKLHQTSGLLSRSRSGRTGIGGGQQSDNWMCEPIQEAFAFGIWNCCYKHKCHKR